MRLAGYLYWRASGGACPRRKDRRDKPGGSPEVTAPLEGIPMNKTLPFALGVIPVALLLLALAVPASAQRWRDYGPPPAANINGTWYLKGNPDAPCSVRMYPDGRALFTNENGSQTWGTIDGDRVWIPDWSDGWSQGLSGRIRGDRILWPGGSFWSR
jgi:hypothetical protein